MFLQLIKSEIKTVYFILKNVQHISNIINDQLVINYKKAADFRLKDW